MCGTTSCAVMTLFDNIFSLIELIGYCGDHPQCNNHPYTNPHKIHIYSLMSISNPASLRLSQKCGYDFVTT